MSTAKPVAKAPLSSHPAFVWVVSLWFAGLLGLSAMVASSLWIERLAGGFGLAGLTARLVIAAGLALIGAGIGLLAARLIAQGKAPRKAARSRDRQEEADEPAPRRKRMIVPQAELGSESLDTPLAEEGEETAGEMAEATASETQNTVGDESDAQEREAEADMASPLVRKSVKQSAEEQEPEAAQAETPAERDEAAQPQEETAPHSETEPVCQTGPLCETGGARALKQSELAAMSLLQLTERYAMAVGQSSANKLDSSAIRNVQPELLAALRALPVFARRQSANDAVGQTADSPVELIRRRVENSEHELKSALAQLKRLTG